MIGFAIVLLVVVTTGSGAIYFLVTSPNEQAWLRDQISMVINDQLGDQAAAKLGGLRFVQAENGLPTISIAGFELKEANDRLSFSAETVDVDIEWYPLIEGRVVINEIRLRDVDMLVRLPGAKPSTQVLRGLKDEELPLRRFTRDGGLEEGLLDPMDRRMMTGADLPAEPENAVTIQHFAVDEGQSALMEEIGAALVKIGQGLDRAHGLELDQFEAENVTLRIENAEGPVRTVPFQALSLITSVAMDGKPTAVLNASMLYDGMTSAQLKLRYIRDVSSVQRAFLFSIHNIIAAHFIERLNRPNYPIKVGTPFSTSGSIVVDDSGHVKRADVDIKATKGVLETGPKALFVLDEAHIAMTLNARTQRVTVKASKVRFGETRFVSTGEIALPVGLLDPYAFTFRTEDSIVDASDVNEAPVLIDRMITEGAFQPRHKAISISSFRVDAETFSFGASSTFAFEGKTPSMALAAHMTRTPVETFKQIWPIFIAPSARSWVISNIHDGYIESGTVTASVPAGVLGNLRKGAVMEVDEMVVDFRMASVEFSPLSTLPRIADSQIAGRIRGTSLELDVTEATATSSYGGSVALRNGTFSIADTRFPDPDAQIRFQAEGQAKDVGDIANNRPMRALDRGGLQANALSGSVVATVALDLPLKRDIRPNHVFWNATLDVTSFASTEPIQDRKIENADASIEIDAQQMTIRGKGIIDGFEADLDLTQPFTGDVAAPTVAVTVVLDDEDRSRLGLGLDDYLEGPISVSIDQPAARDVGEEIYDIDLSRAQIKLDALGWRKTSGIPARARMRVRRDQGRTFIDDFVLSGDGFGAEGSIELNSEGEIRLLELSTVFLRPGDVLSLEARLVPERTYEVTVSGTSFDARSLIRTLTSAPTADEIERPYRYQIEAKIGRVEGYQRVAIGGLEAEVTLRGSTVLRLTAQGAVGPQSQPFSIVYGARDRQGDVLNAEGGDGGALLRFANIYERAYGGVFSVVGVRPTGATDMTGTLDMRNFILRDEPALRSITTGRDDDGVSSVLFKVLDVDFVEEEGRLTVTKGLISGDEAGGTYRGVLNRRTKGINFTGTYVPAYVLNNFFTKIPLVGLALGNGQREGLIGVTFKVTGSIGRPNVTVNPLSALAPGFLRQFFRFRRDGEQTN